MVERIRKIRDMGGGGGGGEKAGKWTWYGRTVYKDSY